MPARLPAGPDEAAVTAALRTLRALALDCQTTGTNAARDHLIEVGWARIEPRSAPWPASEAVLLRLPPGFDLPPRLRRLTGLSPQHFHAAWDHQSVWRRLVQVARSLDDRSRLRPLVVIHYARFEKPFLESLQAAAGDLRPFPFRIVCTHAIARRLLPGLPRRGLNALAGYLGFRPPEQKRAGEHAVATRMIWAALAGRLADEGIETLDALEAWLARPPSAAVCQRLYPMPAECRRALPDAPGVYRMRRANGDLLYVGKARSLRTRVNSYFHAGRRHPEHILEMLTQARDLDFSLTASALAAALQETEEIQKEAPPYNRQLRPRAATPVYCSRDFQRIGLRADRMLAWGPFPDPRLVMPLAALTRWCAGSVDVPPCRAELAAQLDRPSDYVPDPETFTIGLRRFRQALAGELPANTPDAARALCRFGALLWRTEDGEALAADEALEAVREERDGAAAWTSDAVVRMLEGVARRGAHLVRRGRWFRLLRGARLSWAAPSAAGGRTAAGREGHRIWCVPAHDSAALYFSAQAYDRLRVFTTELRRLVYEGRDLELVLAAGTVLTRRRLQRILAMI
jgi:DNA polymerase-3 subunit epsilon